MGRLRKPGLDYFPFDTNFWENSKIKRVMLNKGLEAVAMYVMLLCRIYGRHGYYAKLDSDLFLDLGYTLSIQEEDVKDYISFFVAIGLFDANMANRCGILTTAYIQEVYRHAKKKGVDVINPLHLLIRSEDDSPIAMY